MIRIDRNVHNIAEPKSVLSHAKAFIKHNITHQIDILFNLLVYNPQCMIKAQDLVSIEHTDLKLIPQ